jgi:enterochelin esterase family protein
MLAQPEADLKKGTAVSGRGGDLTFSIQTDREPSLVIDGEPGPKPKHSGGTYSAQATLAAGRTHSFYWMIDGAQFGGKTDVAAWPPEAYQQPGAVEGKLTGKLSHTSSIYPEMKSDYWVYAAAGYDPARPAPVMIWQDGEVNVDRNGASHTLNVIDNLTHQKRIPPMIHIFISAGLTGDRRMRSIEYDTVDDTYPRFLRDEILPEVSKSYNLRKDAYSRAIIGESSGGICAFNAAWQMPDQFARVVSRIGSFTSIQWKPNKLDGGQSYPNKVRKESKRNIRVWLQDGSEDLENEHGSWPLQNIQMANSLKRQGYDFKFSFGNGTHTRLGGQVEAPAELEWVWRGYDPSRTEEAFAPDPAEKDRPFYRVKALNR